MKFLKVFIIVVACYLIFAVSVISIRYVSGDLKTDPIACDINVDNLVKAHNKLRGDTLIVDDRLTAYAWNRHPEFVRDFINVNVDGMDYEEQAELAHKGFQEDVGEWFPNTFMGENISYGYCSEELMMKGWVNSPGHYKNIMDKRFDSIGIYSEDDYTIAIFGDLN